MDTPRHDDDDNLGPEMGGSRRSWLGLIVLVGLLALVIVGIRLVGPSGKQQANEQSGDASGQSPDSAESEAPWRPTLTTPDNKTLPPSTRPEVEILHTDDESLPPEALIAAMTEEALALTVRLTEEFPRRTDALAATTLVLQRYGRYEEAVAGWNACLDLDPRFAGAYHGLGSIALKQGDSSQAAAMLAKALLVNPQLPDCRHGLAEALMDQGKMTEAAAVLAEEIAAFGETAQTHCRLGQVFSHLEEHEKAKQSFLAAVRVDPDNAEAYSGLATTCEKLGLADEAARYRQEFAQRERRDLEAEGAGLKTRDDVLEARKSLAFAYLVTGQFLGHMGEMDRAESSWRTAASLDPQATPCRELLQALCQLQGRTDEAAAWNEQLQRIDPENFPYHLGLGILLAEAKHLGAAENAFRKVIELTPGRPDGYYALARFFLTSGRKLPEARTFAQKAVDLAPTARNYSVLCAACAANDDRAAAIAAAGKAMQLEPGNPNHVGLYRSLQEGTQP